MFFGFDLKILLSGLIVLAACVDDLRTRKIHNKLILILLPFVLIAVFLLQGTEGLKTGGFSALLALAIGVPLALMRVVGGGDLKLLVLFALAMNWSGFLNSLIYSFPWAFLLGLFKIILDKKFKEFLFNLLFLFKHRTTKNLKLHSIPFSFSLFFGWLTFLTLKAKGMLIINY